MNGVKEKIGKEGLILISLDEVIGFLPETEGVRFPIWTGFYIGFTKGREKAAPWTTHIRAALIDIKPMIGGAGNL